MSFGLNDDTCRWIILYTKRQHTQADTEQLMKYAVSRNQRWPEIEKKKKKTMQMFNNAFGPEPITGTNINQMIMTSLDRMMTQLKPYIDKYGWPELEQYKSQLLAKIQKLY